jgi:hypothetical protein
MKKEFKFDFDVSALSNYTNETNENLLSQSLMSDPTSQYVSIMPGVKSAENINTLDSDLALQSGAAGFSAGSSATDFDFETLTVSKFKINEVLDPYALEQKWIQVAMQPGSIQEGIPFEAYIANEKAEKISKIIAQLSWQGSTSGATGAGNLAFADGFIHTLEGQATRVIPSGATGSTAFNASNIVATLDNMIANLDEDVLDRDDLVLWVSPAMYRTLVNALKALNNFWIDPAMTVDGTFMYPFSNVRVVRTYGLANSASQSGYTVNSNDAVILGPSRLMFWGTDLVSDYSTFKLFYVDSSDEVRFIFRAKLGTQVVYPQYFVTNF